jgi:DNA-directed RNA polymerase
MRSVPDQRTSPRRVEEILPGNVGEKFHKKLRKLESKREQMAASGAGDKAMHWINGQIKAHVKQFKQDKRQFKLDLAEAERLATANAPFYLELRCDFRGRVTPLPYLHYQRGDYIRALFLFDRSEPIGQSINRLKDHAAACWGHGWDKKTWPERRQWCDENWDLIERTAKQESKEWFKAENRYLFLAACTDLVAAVAKGPTYKTRLPISFDGLTNGLVHYCCLTRQDPIGLLAAGSTATPAVDAYMVVAKKVNPDKPDRALAKQPVQQYFYGATNKRRADQIQSVLEDRDDVSLPSDPKEAAKLVYAIGENHRKAIENLFPGAKETMQFLQDIARVLAKLGAPLHWPTPTGFPLINLYEEPQYKDIESKLRGVRVRQKIAVGNKPVIRVGKSKNAVAANVIHGLDASHMMLTSIACKRAGIDLMGIHDCYACLAPQAERLNEIIRQELERMYAGRDYLTEIRDAALRIAVNEKKRPSKMAEALSKHPLARKGKRVAAVTGIEAPEFRDVPKLGSFDLREILKNVYLFSP